MTDTRIRTLDDLRAHYPNDPLRTSVEKELDRLSPGYTELIRASPFCLVSTIGPDGIDVSPRGDGAGFVRVRDDRTLELPDRRGNNRLDTLRNLIDDPRVGLLFLVPGLEECVRVRGTAELSVDPELLSAHAMKGAAPASAMVVRIQRVYFQCARAIKRSHLWDAERHVERGTLPTAGQLAHEAGAMSARERDEYDAGLEDRQRATLY